MQAGGTAGHAGRPHQHQREQDGAVHRPGRGFRHLFGLPALKLDGVYLALATFALGVATPQLLKYKGFEPWTGGSQGLVLMKPEAPFGLPLDADQWLYFFSLAVALALFAAARNLLRGGVGLSLVAVRDHPIAAQAMGVDNARVKTLTFGISALYTSVGGALSAIVVQFVAPDSFSVFLSITLLVGAVVGGLSSLSGALYGALFIQFVPQLAEQVSKAAPWAVYGAILLALMLVWPMRISVSEAPGSYFFCAAALPQASARPAARVAINAFMLCSSW